MGLKQKLQQSIAEQEQSESEDLNQIQELTDKLEQAEQKTATLTLINSKQQSKNQELLSVMRTAQEQIESLTNQVTNLEQATKTLESTNSTLQSDNQKMQSAVMTAQRQIESLTSRAAVVNSTEEKNKVLAEQSRKALGMKDRAAADAAAAAARANEAAQKANEAEQARRKAEKEAFDDKLNHESRQNLYKWLFIGNSAFTVVLAFLVAYSKKEIFAEIGKWFADRAGNFGGFVLWLKGVYM